MKIVEHFVDRAVKIDNTTIMKTEMDNRIVRTRQNRFAIFAGNDEVAVVLAEAEAIQILMALNQKAIRANRVDELSFAI